MRLGAYQYGTDPEVDDAIDKIETFLRQRTEEASSYDATVAALIELFSGADY